MGIWAELLTSFIKWYLETTLWSVQQLFKLYNQFFDDQLWGKQFLTRFACHTKFSSRMDLKYSYVLRHI